MSHSSSQRHHCSRLRQQAATILLYACMLPAMTACTLNEHPRDQIDEEQAFRTTASLYRNTVATLYALIGGTTDGKGLQGTCRGIYDLQTFGSNEALLPTRGGDWYDGGMWQQMYCHSWQPGHELLSNSWMYLYKVITMSNRSLAILDTHSSLLTDEQLLQYKAEVRALRAIYYWYLLDLFGNVPVITINGYGTDNEDTRFSYNYWADIVYDHNYASILDRTGQPLVYYPWEVQLNLSGSPYVETAGARMKKYEVDKNSLQGGQLIDNDIVLFRFADVLLMRAEAKVRLGLDGQADLDAVRSRAYMPLIPCDLDNILDERCRELAWEGWRRQDLIRFGKYESLYNGPGKIDESDGHTTLFPIPSIAIDLNSKLKQNKGY